MSKCGNELLGEGSPEKRGGKGRRGVMGFLKRAKFDPSIFRTDSLSVLAFNTSKKTREDQCSFLGSAIQSSEQTALILAAMRVGACSVLRPVGNGHDGVDS